MRKNFANSILTATMNNIGERTEREREERERRRERWNGRMADRWEARIFTQNFLARTRDDFPSYEIWPFLIKLER